MALGAPANEAAIVANELVEASLMGLESHGVTRYIWYAEQVLGGRIKPGARVEVVRETPATAIVDVHFNFGPVGAQKMAQVAIAKARANGVSCVISRHCHHIGRLGSYTQRIAEQGLIGFGTTCSHKEGHYVVPWGGKEARLATNPISYAAPTNDRPIVLDMSTSMISEGKIRTLMYQGKDLPPGCVLDSSGNPTTDPKAFYESPGGLILPFGGEQGYKGFGLSLLTMILGEVMAGEDITDEYHYLNGLCLVSIDPTFFCDLGEFKGRMDRMCKYMKTAPPAPGFQDITTPGELDFRAWDERLKCGITLPDETWARIGKIALELDVPLET